MYKLLFLVLLFSKLTAEEAPKPLVEMTFDHSGQLQMGEKQLDYRGQAGTLVLKDEQGKDKGAIFYLAYFLKGVPSADRPITFCFNGGPGAGSAWLSLGLAGPKTLSLDDLKFKSAPYSLENNPSSLLDLTDLVFVDPIGTGLSMAAAGCDLKKVYSVEEDAQIMSEFVRQFTVKVKRWDSPKYLLGESYGGLRAILMAYRLHDIDGYYLNGLILVGPALDMQTLLYNEGNDLPYVLSLPTFAAAAKYHKKATTPSSPEQVEAFAKGRYLQALFAGSSLEKKEKEEVAEQMAGMIGLSKEYILQNELRISTSKFRKTLLADQKKCLGRFDARISGSALGVLDGNSDYDPSLDAVFGAVTAGMNQYLEKDFKWPEQRAYNPLVTLPSWDWGKGNQYANGLGELRKLMTQNPELKVFIAMGEFDLAIPSASLQFALRHAMIPEVAQDRIYIKQYPAGHMFYFDKDKLLDFKSDVDVIYKK